jgi:hypothetical protein
MIESEDTFKKNFLTVNFDEFLFENNNDLVNSNEHYITFKTEYLDKTNINFNKYKILIDQFKKMEDNYKINNTKYSYTFVNKDEYNKLNKELKHILSEQRQLYLNFMNYIQFLNSK